VLAWPESAVPRAAASVNLAAVVTACVAAALFLPGLPRAAPEQAASAPQPVRVVDAPASGKPCAEQSWPYLDAQCLKRAPESATSTTVAPGTTSPSASPPLAAPSQTAISTAALSPVTPAAPAAPMPARSWSTAAPTTPAQPQASTNYTRSYTAGAAVAGPADVEDVQDAQGIEDEPPLPAPRPKKHRRHHGFQPFGFLGIRF
jgi:hypothetical protein